MSKIKKPGRGKRFLVRFVSALLIITIVLSAFGVVTARRSFPQVDGELTLAGLDGPVDVYRDSMGIPHIYATTLHDLFMAQGYVHAQERFWQMDFWRHVGSGRLSEMFGDSQVDTDAFLRTLGWAQVAEQELAASSPEDLAILAAYAEGVNAYLAEHSGTELSLEYGVLKLLNPDYQPEPWTPLHTMTWAKAMAWDLRGNMDAEIERAILLKSLKPEQVAELYPSYPADHPVIVPDIGGSAAANPLYALLATEELSAAAPDLELAAQKAAALDALLGPSGTGIGSNSWAVSGGLTATGTPLLANDPHLGIQMPSIWFQVGLHCRPKTEACPYEIAGFSFAGVPGVVIGHNDKIAWGFTNVGPDVMDLYIEKINPDNPNQYEVNGQWVDMDVRTETILVGGGDPVELTIRSTRHGPIISETFGALKDQVEDPTAAPFRDQAGIDLPEHYAIALRWTALEPGHTFSAIWGFNKAQNWQEFRQAARGFTAPAQNLLYADVDGNIGYQMPGNIPIRASGDGTLPVPGWTDDYEWTGYVPFEELPYTLNPAEGYIVTANNQVNPPGYPYLITTDWDYGFRANRIVDMITSAPGPIDIAYIRQMQGDSYDANAATYVPLLMAVELNDPDLARTRGLLTGWDYQARMDSAPAALFEVFWKNLLADTFHDDLPEDYWPGGGSRWNEVMRNLSSQPNSAWWDDKTTADTVETRDDILAAAFAKAVAEITQLQGKNSSKWNWGGLHTATFRNGTLGESGIAPIEALFNRGPFRTAGGESIVNATGWTATDGYFVDWLPSMRMIVDLGDLRNSLTVHTTGESGHAYHPHYIDMADLWRNLQYYPMLWNEQAIISSAESHLILKP
ncbi:MAG: acyl-homoserine-lactone acylase [Anaerolineaceae bacterium]|nr:MAG: acyl-homoserine-lactone acylase [Anaerolineaceae bacterium]